MENFLAEKTEVFNVFYVKKRFDRPGKYFSGGMFRKEKAVPRRRR